MTCEGCGARSATCGPDDWARGVKCCPDCTHGPDVPACTNDDCDRPAEPNRDLCAQCHDKAGEAQDARDAEGLS
jgi:hypothetical protein